MRIHLAATLVFCALAATPTLAGLAEGRAAYQRGDHATAFSELRPLAEQGRSAAQNLLGVMYARGQGVAKDEVEAAKWFRKAAVQGDAYAQYALGNA